MNFCFVFRINELSKSRSGIFRKHIGQIFSLLDLGNEIFGIFMHKNFILFVKFNKNLAYEILESFQVNQLEERECFWSVSSDIINSKSFNFTYVRYDYSYHDKIFFNFVEDITAKTKIILEIPTFPYEEIIPSQFIQIENSRRRRILGLIDHVTTPSRVHSIDNKSTFVFDNGYYSDFKKINLENNLIINNLIKLIMTANFAEWHGAERILYSLKSYLSKSPDSSIRLVLVGDGPELPRLKKITEKLKLLDNVNFEGFVHVDKLPYYYSSMSCGLCTLGEYNANRQDSSTLKSKEYLMHGLPVVYAVDDPVLDNSPYTLKVANDSSIPDMERICSFVTKMQSAKDIRQLIYEYHKDSISWKPFAKMLTRSIS